MRPAALVVVLALGLTGCASGDDDPVEATPSASGPVVTPEGFDRVALTVTTADGTVCELCVWRASTRAERSRGLMGVTDLGDADGMAFVYDTAVSNRFWMRDTPLPLDIAWFDDAGTLVGTAAMAPCVVAAGAECPRYAPDAPFALALELPAGDLARLGIGAGSVAVLGAGAGCDTP